MSPLLLLVVASDPDTAEDLNSAFAAWRRAHGKGDGTAGYETPEQAAYRRAIFAAERASVLAHNELYAAGASSYWRGLNAWSDLTDAEFVERATMPLGSKIERRGPSAEEEAIWHTLVIPDDVPVGTTVDWRGAGPPWPGPGGQTGPVWWQGNCGSCWAFAGVGAAAATYAIRANVTYVEGSIEEIMDCCLPSEPAYDCLNCQGGEPVEMLNAQFWFAA